MADKNKDKKNAGAAGAANTTGAAKDAKGTGAQASVPQLPTTNAAQGGTRMSPAAVAGAAKVVNISRLPKIAGMPTSGGKRGSNGVKRSLYALFAIPYAHWTKYARFIANGQRKCVFPDGMAATTENRIFIILDLKNSTEVTRVPFSELAAYTKEHDMKALNQYPIPAWVDDETIEAKAFFVNNLDLSEFYTKLAAETLATNPELSAQHTETAKIYGGLKKYDGYVCSIAGDIAAVVGNVRNFYALNPEAENEFTEIETYVAPFGQEGLEPIANAEWATTAEGIAAIAAEKAEAEKESAAASTEVATA